MAPNPTSNGQKKRPHGRMVQPALPLIPALKGKPSQKPTPAQAETEKVESISTLSTAVNGDNQVHSETTAAAPAAVTELDAPFEASSEEKDITELAGQCAAHENYLRSLTHHSRFPFRHSSRAACDE